jgi:histidine triad (HIT) family protein
MASIFSKIISGEIPAHKIDENDDFLAFLDVFPLVKGHILVVPKKETDYMFDMADEELSSILPFAKRIAAAQKKAVTCKRIGIAVIGLEVPHAHMHLVPMNTANDLNFTQPKIKVTEDELREIAAKIRSFL